MRVRLTRDLAGPDGRPRFGPAHLAGLDWAFLPEQTEVLTPEVLGDAEALLHFSANRVTAALLARRPALRLVARLGVGLDTIDRAACAAAGVEVTITAGAVPGPIAQGAVAMLAALAYALPAKHRLVQRGQWDRRLDTLGVGLAGQALGIVGLGRIGRQIVAASAGFGLRYLAYGPRLSTVDAARVGVRAVGLDELLSTVDFLAVCCPLTDDTRGLLSADRLARLRPGAIVVDVSRGGIVDQAALAAALRAGRLGGAGVDVYDPEPPPAGHPLGDAPNTILAPHSVGYTGPMLDAMMAEACASVRSFATRAGGHNGQ